jgi:hypothetical protein
MNQFPVAIYYVPCPEDTCWALFKRRPKPSVTPACRLHGHQLELAEVLRGYVTELEAKRGWTKQRPD